MVARMPQVRKVHYFDKYDDLERFISYFYQIDLVKSFKPSRVLEIGVGNKTVSDYLKKHGFNVTTCDYDKRLRPDRVADVRNLPFKSDSYDFVICCEVLEHMPWNDACKALDELHRVSKRYVVISIPYSCSVFEFVFKFPFVRSILGKKFLDLFIRIPLFFKAIKFDGEHYWELGSKGYSIWKVRDVLRTRFKILKEVRPVLNPNHHFFVLVKE